jgi:NADPH-dependent glutamate synthase beta subunit-like oxidoreductase
LETIKLNIDGRDVETQAGKSILEAALDAGVYIPHLCHHPDLPPIGACRLCIVEIEGVAGIHPSCVTPAENGITVRTKTEVIERMRRLAMELMLAGHPADCGSCDKYLNCELQSLKQYLGVEELSVKRRSKLLPINTGNPLFVHDPNKCVACGRCVRACQELRGVGILLYVKKGQETLTGTAADLPLADSGCRFCGACAEVCPTGAIQDRKELVEDKKRKAALVPCTYSCPAEIDVPRYLRFIGEKNYSAATAVIREKVPFPGVLGYVCEHPCEDVCRRGEINQPISIRELKRFAAEHDDEKMWEKNLDRKPATGNRVAIIGAGPAGLTAAYYLSKQGHEVTVFESLPLAGGMLRFGIPEYRLPREVLDSEIKYIEDAGVDIKTGTRVASIEKLLEEDYNGIIVAIGTHRGQKLPIPGADNAGVLIGVDFLRDINLGIKVSIGKSVLVLGGGNVAFDCARVARRLGAGQVKMACLESREAMPAVSDEIKQGEEEGIALYPARTFTRILCENERVTGVSCLEVESFFFNEDNNPQIEARADSGHILEADTVIFAIGQLPEIPEGFGLDTSANSLIEMDPYAYTTSREGVFAAGDVVTGPSSVIKAIASGRKAAIALDRFLGGSGNIDEKLAPLSEVKPYLGPWEGFASLARCRDAHMAAEERLKGFCRVVRDMAEKEAGNEARRCLQCDSRLKITPVKFWGNY